MCERSSPTSKISIAILLSNTEMNISLLNIEVDDTLPEEEVSNAEIVRALIYNYTWATSVSVLD